MGDQQPVHGPVQHFTPGKSKDPAVLALRADRRELVSTLLVAGASIREMQTAIHTQMGIRPAHGTVQEDIAVVRREWGRTFGRNFAEHAHEHNARLDALWRAVAPQAMKGDTAATDTALRILDRKAKLLGLDQPDRLLVAAVSMSDRVGAASAWDGAEQDEQVQRALAILAVLNEVEAFTPVEEESAIDV